MMVLVGHAAVECHVRWGLGCGSRGGGVVGMGRRKVGGRWAWGGGVGENMVGGDGELVGGSGRDEDGRGIMEDEGSWDRDGGEGWCGGNVGAYSDGLSTNFN